MEAAKPERSGKVRTLTRRIGELRNAYRGNASRENIIEKIGFVKRSFEELGNSQDTILDLVGDEPDEQVVNELQQWYYKYDEIVNIVITGAREYLKTLSGIHDNPVPIAPFEKMKKLKLPLFESQPRKYLKWKETFERYTVNLTDDIKYDYLLESTKGKAHEYVENTSNFINAIEQLDK